MYRILFATIFILACSLNIHAKDNVLTLDSIIAGSYSKKTIPEMRASDNPSGWPSMQKAPRR